MSKQFMAIIAVIILLFVGIIVVSGNKSNGTGGGKASTPTQHVEGQGKSGVTLVEYGDYQCPFCGQFYPVVKQVQTEFNNQIFVQFRNFPLVSLHPNAFAAARAAEAAGMQNKFWEMHDALYQTQQQWASASDATPIFSQYAKQLGLDVTKFKADSASSKVNDLINADTAAGNKLKVSGTPTFFLDGKQLQVGQANTALSTFESQIKAEIAKKAGQSSAPAPASPGATSQTPAPAKP
jgi:protein-disulfide isomerase